MAIPESLTNAFASPFNTGLGLSSWVGTATGMGIRLINATPPFQVFEKTCQAGPFSNIVTMPLRHAIGTVMVIYASYNTILYDLPKSEGWSDAVRSGLSALAYFATPTLLSATGCVPASLTSDLVRQCMYGIGLERAAEAINHLDGGHMFSKPTLILSTLAFGLWNVTFFAHKVAECVDVHTAWLEMLTAVLVTGGSVLLEHSITHPNSKAPKKT